MSLTVAYAALATGIIVWIVLVTRFRAKPWEKQVAATPEGGAFPFSPKRVGLWVFLAVITSLFCLFVSAYYMRMGQHAGHGMPGGGVGDWAAIRDPSILWFNTVLLILGSVAMQWARSAVARGQAEQTRVCLFAAGLLTIAFLIGQWLAWRELRYSELFSPANPAVAFFYVLTAVHGLHLLGGLVVWARTLVRSLRKDVELIDVRLSVELTTVYWHYLLLVWLGLFAVLLST
ncbi:cytochrome c oxidase subunit 3 [Steroidobacter sp. S1-65]|uniref:Cytochrome c oxidase subunit 3 n=1 Tax=Steroidobacter gossypii TaxID=2805490 RepID=A0ABS1WT49_9GAMM|nr:cytochrome c oxidase subunit 3 [Steroidobacter gossypii]MBM0104155.1 cytochrome c oxidase subunit 3 [Steroidobacter gossypii]